MRELDPLRVALRGTTLIEASAGTGKTQTITSLYVRLLIERGLQVSQILVVTYTNAATAELRARVRQRLLDAVGAFRSSRPSGDDFLDRFVRQRQERGSLEQDRARLLLALSAFDEAAIFTIHGFCQRMLHEHAFESGMPFDTELVTNQTALLREVVEDFWIGELHDAPAVFIRHLQDQGITIESLQHLAMKTVTNPDVPVLPEPTDPSILGIEQSLGFGQCSEGQLAARALTFRLDLVDFARRELRRRKEAARIESFDDLLHRLATALRGSGGGALAERIRQRFSAALIDEFQDTDAVQYEIFHRIYGDSDMTLFLIGDPKQAIYAFRGADVFAYMQAKRHAGQRTRTLRINWRSDPTLVRAASTLFARAQAPFVFADIPFVAVSAAPDARDHLGGTATGQPPLEMLFVPRTSEPGQVSKRDGVINKGWGEGPLTQAVATEMVRFLHSGATIGDRPVTPGDIAVLCRTNRQASLMQEALRRRGVPSVLHTEASVFEAPEAGEVERVVSAMADPADARGLRAALATTLLGQDALALSALDDDEQRWDEWSRQFHTWHDLWIQRSFVTAFRTLLDSQGVAQRLLALLDGDRRLTNVLHLMELLQTASVEEHRGPHALMQWLHEMRVDTVARALLAGETAQIRLESDAAAVKLTTVHKSKGLQYPIVYCPYLWDGSLVRGADGDILRFHDPDDAHRLKLDLGSRDLQAHVEIANTEALAESLRLLYVALTRARHRCSVVWGLFNQADTSALGYLLHQHPGTADDPAAQARARLRSFAKPPVDDDMRADLAALDAAAGGSITVRDLPPATAERYTPPRETPAELRCLVATREIQQTWRVSSFSTLASMQGRLNEPTEAGVDHDAAADVPQFDAQVEAAASTLVTLHEFPAGARTGQLIHDVLQTLDFQDGDPATLREAVVTSLARFGFEETWAAPLCRCIAEVIATPLDDTGTLRLRDIPLRRRLSELEFIFPVADDSGTRSPSHRHAVSLTCAGLAEVFALHAGPSLPADYAERLRRLGFGPLRGFLKGFIDLAFEHGGRWYVIDYKSNFLGPYADDYAPPKLLRTMAEHHYFLQYHLYVVALHRYLKRRLPDYRYEQHFGGVYYLFLRGMAPKHAPAGIYRDRPQPALIQHLSAVLAGRWGGKV